MGVILILILGYVSTGEMTTDLLPGMNLPYAVVYTSYGGASPEEVEMAVTAPVESAMASISNIKSLTSTSRENVSVVILEFEDTANMDSILVEMRESLDQLDAYWGDEIGKPVIMRINPDMIPVMVAAVSAEDRSAGDLTVLVDTNVIVIIALAIPTSGPMQIHMVNHSPGVMCQAPNVVQVVRCHVVTLVHPSHISALLLRRRYAI